MAAVYVDATKQGNMLVSWNKQCNTLQCYSAAIFAGSISIQRKCIPRSVRQCSGQPAGNYNQSNGRDYRIQVGKQPGIIDNVNCMLDFDPGQTKRNKMLLCMIKKQFGVLNCRRTRGWGIKLYRPCFDSIFCT